MSEGSRSTLCPVLVADLADRSARDYIAGIARANGVVVLPLLAAPVDNAIHRLDVFTPGSAEPLVLFAEPAGAPTEQGFPLRLRPPGAGSAPRPTTPPTLHELPGPMPGSRRVSPSRGTPAVIAPLAPRRKTNLTMSERHTRDLAGLPHAQTPEALVGRALANGKLEVESLIGSASVRRRFVEIVHTMGAPALPMIRAGLAKLAPHHQRPVARDLAVDLLLATPNLRDDDAGELASRWARVGPVEVTRAAVPALARLWGERARPLFVAALQSEDLLLANAAVAALDSLGGSDDDVAARVRAVAHAG
jgi:hypothetical protein